MEQVKMMKTAILPRFFKVLAVILVAITLIILLLSYAQMAQNLIASVGWHDMASVGWVN